MGRAVVLPLLAMATLACSNYQPPDLKTLYDQVARYHDQHRNPVVVIPGILGTRLVDDASDRVVWGAFGGGAVSPGNAEGSRFFALPIDAETPFTELRDTVTTDGVLETLELRLAGLPIELQAYVNILRTLGAGGYVEEALSPQLDQIDYGDEHFTCFQFPYDWRRDNVENARALKQFLEEKRAYVAEERLRRFGSTEPVRFDVIAHSMGGLVLRYMLRYGDAELGDDGELPELTWAGADLVDQAILIATPNAGAVGPLVQLVHGRKLGPLIPRYQAALLGTFPSAYQLLPRARHGQVVDGDGEGVDTLDPEVWQRLEWGLADPGQAEVLSWLLPEVEDPEERRRIALAFQRRALHRAARFQEALDRPSAPPEGTELVLFVGDSVPTAHRAEVGPSRAEVVEKAPGDGRVLRTSALMDERVGQPFTAGLRSPIDWSQVRFTFSDHLGITSDPAFSDNVLYLLLEAPR